MSLRRAMVGFVLLVAAVLSGCGDRSYTAWCADLADVREATQDTGASRKQAARVLVDARRTLRRYCRGIDNLGLARRRGNGTSFTLVERGRSHVVGRRIDFFRKRDVAGLDGWFIFISVDPASIPDERRLSVAGVPLVLRETVRYQARAFPFTAAVASA